MSINPGAMIPVDSHHDVVILPTRGEIAHKTFQHSVHRLRMLEQKMVPTFEQLDKAIEGMNKEKIEVHVTMHPAMSEAWASWRAKRMAGTEGR